MKIAIDIDEVVIEFVDNFMGFIEERGVKGVNFDDISEFDLWHDLEISKERFVEFLNEYNDSEHFSRADFVDGAKEGIYFLNDNFDICFITARPESVSKRTRDFIFGEFGISGDKVIFSGESFGKNKTKDEICKELGVGLIIEDDGDNSLICAKSGLMVLLLDKPWNKKFEHKNIVRCFGWDDVLCRVEEVKNGKIF